MNRDGKYIRFTPIEAELARSGRETMKVPSHDLFKQLNIAAEQFRADRDNHLKIKYPRIFGTDEPKDVIEANNNRLIQTILLERYERILANQPVGKIRYSPRIITAFAAAIEAGRQAEANFDLNKTGPARGSANPNSPKIRHLHLVISNK